MRGIVAAASLLLAGCGYHLANAVSDPLGPFVVRGGEVKVPYAAAIAAAEEGARSELSRSGQLSPGGQGSALVIAVDRVDEGATGIAAGAAGAPIARGIRITVIGRAWIEAGGSIARETGEVRASEVMAAPGDAATAIAAREEALDRAARRLGERMARQILGEIDPGEP
jgi:hypothetical protein